MEYDAAKTACFTGPLPRNLYEYDARRYEPLSRKLEKAVASMRKNKYDTFITGGAQGVDQIAFWAVDTLKQKARNAIKNVVFIPLENQDRYWAVSGTFSKQDYKKILEHATEIAYISKNVNPSDNNAVREAMLKRNRAMVDASSLVIGVYPNNNWIKGDRADPGTAYTLKYALAQSKNIIVLNYSLQCCRLLFV